MLQWSLRQLITFLLRCLFVEPISSRAFISCSGVMWSRQLLTNFALCCCWLLTEAMSSFAVVPLLVLQEKLQLINLHACIHCICMHEIAADDVPLSCAISALSAGFT